MQIIILAISGLLLMPFLKEDKKSLDILNRNTLATKSCFRKKKKKVEFCESKNTIYYFKKTAKVFLKGMPVIICKNKRYNQNNAVVINFSLQDKEKLIIRFDCITKTNDLNKSLYFEMEPDIEVLDYTNFLSSKVIGEKIDEVVASYNPELLEEIYKVLLFLQDTLEDNLIKIDYKGGDEFLLEYNPRTVFLENDVFSNQA